MARHQLRRRRRHQQVLLPLLQLQLLLLLPLTLLPRQPLRSGCRPRRLLTNPAQACHCCELGQPRAVAGITAAIWLLALVPALGLLLEHRCHEGAISLAAHGGQALQHWARVRLRRHARQLRGKGLPAATLLGSGQWPGGVGSVSVALQQALAGSCGSLAAVAARKLWQQLTCSMPVIVDGTGPLGGGWPAAALPPARVRVPLVLLAVCDTH